MGKALPAGTPKHMYLKPYKQIINYTKQYK